MNQLELLEAMRGTANPRPVKVPMPEWNGDVYVRVRTVEEVDIDSQDDAEIDKGTRLARGAARVMCDADGKRILDEKNPEHIGLLKTQPWRLLQRLIDAVTPDEKEGDGKK